MVVAPDADCLDNTTVIGTTQHYEAADYSSRLIRSQFSGYRRERIPSQSQQPVVVEEWERPDVSSGLKAYIEAVQNILKVKKSHSSWKIPIQVIFADKSNVLSPRFCSGN